MVEWRNCHTSVVLINEINALFPKRDKSSDGTIGDAAHASRKSDHNPWVVITDTNGKTIGIVRARDIDKDGVPVAAIFEHLRQLGARRDSRLWPGGYLIFKSAITAPDFSGWRKYTGSNPHDKHGHVSFSTNRAGYDSTLPWGIAAALGQATKPPVTPPEDDLKDDERKALLEIAAATRAIPTIASQVSLLTTQLVIGEGDPRDPKTWGWGGWRGGTEERLTVVDNLRRLNTMAGDIKRGIADDGPAASASLTMNALAPMMMEAVQKALGGDNTDLANRIVDQMATRLKE